jgi:hypothetical protein
MLRAAIVGALSRYLVNLDSSLPAYYPSPSVEVNLQVKLGDLAKLLI